MNIEIKHRWTGSVLFSIETENFKLAVEAAVKSGADLRDAYLRGADLRDAYLRDAKIRDDITVTQAPIQITGLYWGVTIWDNHMQIGCEFHSHEEWREFDNEAIAEMSGTSARRFWDAHHETLLALCVHHAETAEKAKAAA